MLLRVMLVMPYASVSVCVALELGAQRTYAMSSWGPNARNSFLNWLAAMVVSSRRRQVDVHELLHLRRDEVAVVHQLALVDVGRAVEPHVRAVEVVPVRRVAAARALECAVVHHL